MIRCLMKASWYPKRKMPTGDEDKKGKHTPKKEINKIWKTVREAKRNKKNYMTKHS